MLVLDRDLRIRNCTPVSGTVLNLTPAIEGQSFGDIVSKLDWPESKSSLGKLIDHAQIIDQEATDSAGRRYLLRVRPHVSGGQKVDELVAVVFDLDALRRALEARDFTLRAERRMDAILNSLAAHVVVVGPDGTILATNDAWNRFAQQNGGARPEAVGPGANYLTVCRHAVSDQVSNAQAVLDGIESVLAGRHDSFQSEYSCHSSFEQRWFTMTVSPLRGTPGFAVIAHVNITDRKLAEISVQKSEFTLRALLESTAHAIIAVNPGENIVLANGNIENMFGYSREELIGQPLRILVPENLRERHGEHHQAYFAHMQDRPMGVGLDLHGRHKDGTIFAVEISLSAIRTEAGNLAVAVITDITQRRRMEHIAQTQAHEVQALAGSLLEAQENERRRVSRELHDQICQQLAALAIDISGLATEHPVSGSIQHHLRTLQDRVIRVSEEARHIAYQLHPSILDDLGLVASLASLCKQFSKRERMPVEFTHAALPGALPLESASCLYRVAQESLTNIAKHSRAKHVSVQLGFEHGKIALAVTDDGVGFDLETVKGRGGLGLIGMEERARLVNGKLSIASRPRQGTKISLNVPMPPETL